MGVILTTYKSWDDPPGNQPVRYYLCAQRISKTASRCDHCKAAAGIVAIRGKRRGFAVPFL